MAYVTHKDPMTIQAMGEDGLWRQIKGHDGALDVYQASRSAGEESIDDAQKSKTRITEDWKWQRVDLADDITTVFPGPCRLGKIYVDTVLSAHACPILDGPTAFASLVASLAAGSTVTAFVGSRFEHSLVIDPDNAASGVILVQYREAEFV